MHATPRECLNDCSSLLHILGNVTCGSFELVASDAQSLACQVVGVTLDPDPLETCLEVACGVGGNAVMYEPNARVDGCEVQLCTSEELLNPPLGLSDTTRQIHLLTSPDPNHVLFGVFLPNVYFRLEININHAKVLVN